jgi:hypothetical protein
VTQVDPDMLNRLAIRLQLYDLHREVGEVCKKAERLTETTEVPTRHYMENEVRKLRQRVALIAADVSRLEGY